ncbi:type II toxin-antitoxin system prevent-host-death family antitoxin [Pandoraea sp. XY-2]|nr:type II toxin-antitoxin system prevent-host-death family antitoxin [Pandoraea sp. XY-2]
MNRNTPVAYLVPAADWEAICERLDDAELADLIRSRASETPVSTQLDDL